MPERRSGNPAGAEVPADLPAEIAAAAAAVSGEGPRSGAFYGRRKGKALRLGQSALMDGLLPDLALDLTTPAPNDLATLFEAPVARVVLEIGFGGGEHLVSSALAEPEAGFIGVEPFLNGMAKALAAIGREGLEPRLRLHHADAVPLLDWLPPASLDRLYLLYPDPWPKKRHWKRRFVDRANLDRIARVLKPGAEFRFASDWPNYVDWTLRRVLAHDAFHWLAEAAPDWLEPWSGWPGTRYEAKALAEGRRPAYLRFRRMD